VESVPLPIFATKAVVRHGARAGTADTPSGATPTSAPANPSATTTGTKRNCRIDAPASLSSPASDAPTRSAYVALRLANRKNRTSARSNGMSADRSAPSRGADSSAWSRDSQPHITAGSERVLDAAEPAFRNTEQRKRKRADRARLAPLICRRSVRAFGARTSGVHQQIRAGLARAEQSANGRLKLSRTAPGAISQCLVRAHGSPRATL